MLDMDIHQKSPFPAGAKIIAPNHPSTTDPFFVAAMLGSQSHILIKDVLFNVPLLGTYLQQSGHIKVAAGHGQEAIDRALELLKAGKTIMIFPEGKISPLSGGYNKARSGVARLAIAGLPGGNPSHQRPHPCHPIHRERQPRNGLLVPARTL